MCISTDYTVVMGMGKTGMACVNFLVKKHEPVLIMDNRPTPPGFLTLKQTFPELPLITGHFDSSVLSQATEIIISPGISRHEPALLEALAKGVPVISEIELFTRYVNAPVVAITGSNGKSTVTTLLGQMASLSGQQMAVGGNLGTPALELLCYPAPDLYILELSSFQLESTYSLNPLVAVVLNISEDHIDRHINLAQYMAAKQRIYQGNGVAIINADDPNVEAMLPSHRKHFSFSLQQRGEFRVGQHNGELYLIRATKASLNPLLPTKSMRLQGSMMRANALAALALGEVCGLPQAPMLEAVQNFRGLKHRCAWVVNHNGVDWYNDSKGTNVGATIAAILSLEKPGKIILIAGGDGKGADFTPLSRIVAQHCRACVLIGQDAMIIAKVLTDNVLLYHATSLEEAVVKAAKLAKNGDAVLLSPACASFDMFKNYEQRGEVFEEAVRHHFFSCSIGNAG